jgi:hypothetical protein
MCIRTVSYRDSMMTICYIGAARDSIECLFAQLDFDGPSGPAALASRAAGGARCKLTASQLRELEAVLDAGPAASGWDEDQR